jgi:hypothetical protein
MSLERRLVLHIKGDQIKTIYDESLDLRALGRVTIQRASIVEPDEDGNWKADLAIYGGPVLGPFPLRSGALQAEFTWLQEHLCSP